ncbi:SlyX family protein [Pseudidiomarina taiwanensis]|nr:SlyX family protein [Pseudidiomarina taiwanensis]
MTVRSDDEILMRLANLESQFAFQEDTIDALNRVIAQQDEQLRLLERRLQLMAEKFQQLQEQNDSDPADPASEIPPHY